MTVAYSITHPQAGRRRLAQTPFTNYTSTPQTNTPVPTTPAPSMPPTPGGAFGLDAWGAPENDSPQNPLFAFEVNQTCSSARIASGALLTAELCAPLKALPPYACTRTVRKPALEILSLATGNAITGMGAYFALAGLALKWKLRRDAERDSTTGGSEEEPEDDKAERGDAPAGQ